MHGAILDGREANGGDSMAVVHRRACTTAYLRTYYTAPVCLFGVLNMERSIGVGVVEVFQPLW